MNTAGVLDVFPLVVPFLDGPAMRSARLVCWKMCGYVDEYTKRFTQKRRALVGNPSPDIIPYIGLFACTRVSPKYNHIVLENPISWMCLTELNLKIIFNYMLDYNSLRFEKYSSSILAMHNLKILKLSYNYIHNLPESFGQLNNLESLNLAGNQISQLPESFRNLTKLKILILHHNLFTIFPNEILQMTELEKLDISHNQILECSVSFSRLSKLVVLDLSDNNIRRLSSDFEGLFELKKMCLHRNRLTSPLPDALGHLTNLEILSIEQYDIEFLPLSIGHLPKLFLHEHSIYNFFGYTGNFGYDRMPVNSHVRFMSTRQYIWAWVNMFIFYLILLSGFIIVISILAFIVYLLEIYLKPYKIK